MMPKLLSKILVISSVTLLSASFAQAQIFDPDANRLKELRTLIAQVHIDQGVGKLEQRLDRLEGKNLGVRHFRIGGWDMWAPENSNLLNIRLTARNAQLHKSKQRTARKACADSLRLIKERLGEFEAGFLPADSKKAQADRIRKFIRGYSNIDLSLEDRTGRERARCNSYFGTSRISYRKSRS